MTSLPSPEWRKFSDPIDPDSAVARYVHAVDSLAYLREECDQQRTRAEAAEAELREAHKMIATMEATADLMERQRAEVEAGLQGMRGRFDATYRMLMRLRAACGMQYSRKRIGEMVDGSIAVLTGEPMR